MERPFDLSEVFDDMRKMISRFEPGYERTNAISRVNECEMWLAKCELKPEILNPSTRNNAIEDVLGFTSKIGIVLTAGEFIEKLANNRRWEVITNFGGRLVLYVCDDEGIGEVYFGPNPLDMNAGESILFLDQVRRLQRKNNQVTGSARN